MAATVYLLCALTSTTCAVLLIRSWFRSRARIVLWSSLCFIGLALNNVLLLIDLIVVPEIDLGALRSSVALVSISILVITMVWERR
jgi:hypothetical protein